MNKKIEVLKADTFNKLIDKVYKKIGINLKEKKSLVVSRLSKRLRQLDIDSFEEYLQLIEIDLSEAENLYNILTTNVTSFFREEHHFNYLQTEYLPYLEDFIEKKKEPKKIRIWSVAAASGEEPYTIAMVVHNYFEKKKGWKIEILASDVNTEALMTGKVGIYKHCQVKGIPYEFLTRYFKLGKNSNDGLFKVKDEIKSMITFMPINLVNKKRYPIGAPLDLIFCRNVYIYFDNTTRSNILDRFYHIIKPEGRLFLGHSESIAINSSQYSKWQLVRQTIFKKIP